MHVVIVGGGFAGLEAAKTLRHAPVRVTLLDRENYHLFQPLLYQVAAAALSPEDVSAPIRQVLARQSNVDVRLADVQRVDLSRRELWISHGEVMAYDRLILAAGARTSYFGNDGWGAYALGLKSIPDALRIRRRILTAFERAEWAQNAEALRREMTFVVIGGGPTGVELAGALAEIAVQTLRADFRHIDTAKIRIIMVEMKDRLLPTFPERLGQSAQRVLESMGVEVRLGGRVETVDQEGVVVNGERIDSRTVLWGAGVEAVSLTRSMGLPLDRSGRICVDEDLSIPGYPDAFAVGDLALAERGGQEPVPGLAHAAMQMGRHAGRMVIADAYGEPRIPFRYRHFGSLATVGRRRAVADLPVGQLTGAPAWLVWGAVHLWQLIGFGNRVIVLAKWGWALLTRQRSSRVIWMEAGPVGQLGEQQVEPDAAPLETIGPSTSP